MSKFLTVGDVCNITTGSLDSNAFVENGKYPFYTCAKEPTNIDTYAFDDDVVLVAGNNAQGNFHVNRFKGKFNAYQRTYILTSKGEKSIDYIYYLLSLALKLLKDKSQGSQTKFLTIGILKEIHVPNLANSQIVAKVLSDLDTKIELNNRINRELEAMAKTLYDYWFVQFDFPNEQGKPYKSSGGKMVYNIELKREIPEGWEMKKLSDIATTGSGGTPLSTKKEYYENGNIPWINSGEVNMPFIVSTKNFITQKGLENSSAKMFKRGTILMAMYGATAGKVSFMDIEACTNQAICAINPKEDFHRIYIKLMLEDLYKYLINLSSGSARDNLSQDKIRELKFVIPSKSLIQKFDIIVQSSMNKILINLKQNQQLTELRDWLLPMLMNGQVTVKEAEESLSMAAEPSVEYKKG
jgi:type I restriction enzyme S subunit